MPFIKVVNGHRDHKGEEILLNADRIVNAVPNESNENQTVVFMDTGQDGVRAYFVDVAFWKFSATLENRRKPESS